MQRNLKRLSLEDVRKASNDIPVEKDETFFFYPLEGFLCASRDWKDFLYTLFNAYRHCLTFGRTVFQRWEYLCICVWQTMPWGHVLAGKKDEGNSESNEAPTSPIWSRKIKKVEPVVPVDWLGVTWHSKQSYFCPPSSLTSSRWQMTSVWPPVEAILHPNSFH